MAIRKLIGNHHIADSIIRYRACEAEINDLTYALLVKHIENYLRIIAVDIPSDDYLLLGRGMRKEIDIQSLLNQRALMPILRESTFSPSSL